MRKRTIFRSSPVLVGCAVLALGAGALQAQEPMQVQVPEVHVVVEGETLWDLAARYFGDPFLWPEIYRINTNVVEDPHWIFPGEELRLAALEAALAAEPAAEAEPGVEVPVEAVVEQEAEGVIRDVPPEAVEPGVAPPPAAPPPPPSADVPTVFAGRGLGDATVTGFEPFRHRAARRSEFYAAGFLTEAQALPWGRTLGRVGQERLTRLPESSFATVFEYIGVEPPLDASYQVGDSLVIGVLTRAVPNWGQIFYPTGVVVVTEAAVGHVIAQVLMQFQRITDDQVALPLEPFYDPGEVLPLPVENGMMGSIIVPRDLNPVPGQQQVVFIDLGRDAGITVGDMFSVLRMDKGEGMEPREVARIRIVHVRDESATGMIVNIRDLGVEAGASVQLLRKMP